MGWVKLSDDAPRHPKVLGLSDAAFRLWIDGMCYAAHWLTDGRLPPEYVAPTSKRCVGELVNAGLWKPEPDGSVTIHDWRDYNPSADETRDRRTADRERKRRQRRGDDGRYRSRDDDASS